MGPRLWMWSPTAPWRGPGCPPKNGNVSSMSQSHSREPSGVATPSRQKLAAITWSHDFTRAVLSRTGFSPVKRGQCQPVKSDERSVRDSVDEGLRRGQKGPLCPKSVPFALFAEKAIICGKVSFVQVIGEKNPRTLEPCGFQESGEIFSNSWCGRRDSNSYSLRRWNLNLVPELGQFAKPFRYKGLARILHRWDTLCNAKFVSQVSPCVPVCPAPFWVGPRSPLRAYSARATNQKMCPN